MASLIGFTSGTGNSITSLPSHQAGDLLIAWQTRDGGAVGAKPTSFTQIDEGDTGSQGVQVSYLIATGSSESGAGTTTTSNWLVACFRPGAGETLGIGSYSQGGTLGTTTALYQSIASLTNTDGTSLIAACCHFANNDSALSTEAPGSLTLIGGVDNASPTCEMNVCYTPAGVSSWAGDSFTPTGATSANRRQFSVEITVVTAASGTILPQMMQY